MAGPIKRTVVKREELLADLKDLATLAAVVENSIPQFSELTAHLIEIDGEATIRDALKSLRVLARTLPSDAIKAKKFPPDAVAKKKG